jgi:hypothetical protein
VVNLPIVPKIQQRDVPLEPTVYMKNRFYESNPTLSPTGTAVIARPGMRKFAEVGTGPIRKVFSESGTFNDCLFVVSNTELYKVLVDGTQELIGTLSNVPFTSCDMAVAANVGDIPERLFISEGSILWVYVADGQALGHLQATGVISNGDVVRIDNTYYQFTSGSVDTGTPAGTVGAPWLVAHTGAESTDMGTLFSAINHTGTPGTDYSSLLVAHTSVIGYQLSNLDMYVAAISYGAGGNAIVTTETSAGLTWDAATLEDGGTDMLRQVLTPNDEGAISIAHINGYIIVIPAQTAGVNGRFYWIQPAEITIDPLDYATAERNADAVNQVVVYSDMFWLCGQSSLEPWITSGDPEAPMLRFKGILYDRGCWEGTALRMKEGLMLVDDNGAVFRIQGGLNRISTPDIEELFRRNIQFQQQFGY